jgi:predicted nucleic acid-binding protein
VKAFLDTNILVYVFMESAGRTSIAESLLLDGANIGVQTLNELVNVGRGKLKKAWPDVLRWLQIIEELCPPPIQLSNTIHRRGIRIAQTHNYHIYDALMLAAALEASCTVFYSEDMQDGHVIDRMTICNPFT